MPDVQPIEQVIVVTGRGIEVEERLAATLTIDRAKIDRSASGRMEDVLRDVAGLASFRRSDSRSANPTSQGLTLRGLGGNAASRVTLFLDGVPQADPFGGWIAFGALDPAAIDRIRITRGGGTDAVAGTIAIDSRAPDRLTASLLGGSHESIDARALVGHRWGSGFVSLSGSVSRGDGFVPIVASDRGPVDRPAPFKLGNVRARLVQQVGAVEAQASLSTYRDRRDRGTDFTFNRQRGTDASLRLVGKGSTSWSALAYFQDRRFDSQFAAINADRSVATLTLDQRVPAKGYGARVEAQPTLGAFDSRIGAEWRHVSGRTEEDFRFVAGRPTREREAGGRNTTAGLFAGASWSSDGWSLSADARADRWSLADGRLIERELTGAPLTETNFAERSGWEGSGRVAVGRRLNDQFALRVAAYRGWRLPTLNELYRPFRAGTDATAANAALAPERLMGLEAGLDWTPIGGTKLSATAFANRLKNAIANVSLGLGPGTFPQVGFVGAGGTFRERQNVTAIDSRGIEIDGTVARGPWRAALSYAFTDARIEADGPAAALDGKRPAQVARHGGSATIGWSVERLSLDATARLTGRQYEDDNNDRRLSAALTFDGVARFALTDRFSIEGRAENIFDKAVIATLAADGTRERALPRTLWIGLSLR